MRIPLALPHRIFVGPSDCEFSKASCTAVGVGRMSIVILMGDLLQIVPRATPLNQLRMCLAQCLSEILINMQLCGKLVLNIVLAGKCNCGQRLRHPVS